MAVTRRPGSLKLPDGAWWRTPEAAFARRLVFWGAMAGLAFIPLSLVAPAAMHLTAQATARATQATGLAASVAAGNQVVFGGGQFRYQVIFECTAVGMLLLWAVAVMAFPATARQRAAGLGLGALAILVLNLVRLVSLAWVGVRAPAAFDIVHGFAWEPLNILFVALGWLAWTRALPQPAFAGRHRGRFARPAAPEPGRWRWGLGRAAWLGGTLAAFVVAAAYLGAAGAYGAVMVGAAHAVGIRLVAGGAPAWMLNYGGLAATVALFAASPVPWRRRGAGLLRVGLPCVLAGQLLYLAVLEGTVLSTDPLLVLVGVVGMYLAGIGQYALPLFGWLLWARRRRDGVAPLDRWARPAEDA